MGRQNKGPFSDEQLKEIMDDLIEGQRFPCYTGDLPKGKPEWFNEKKFKAGQRLTEKYFNGVFFADIVSLTMLLFSPQVLRPLIFTQKSETPDKAYRRYVQTSAIVACWYRDDIWDEGSAARRTLRMVRKYHSDAAATVNDPQTRPKVDEIRSHLEPLHNGRPVHEAVASDFRAVKSCPFFPVLNDSYKKLYDSAPMPAIYFNQVIWSKVTCSISNVNYPKSLT